MRGCWSANVRVARSQYPKIRRLAPLAVTRSSTPRRRRRRSTHVMARPGNARSDTDIRRTAASSSAPHTPLCSTWNIAVAQSGAGSTRRSLPSVPRGTRVRPGRVAWPMMALVTPRACSLGSGADRSMIGVMVDRPPARPAASTRVHPKRPPRPRPPPGPASTGSPRPPGPSSTCPPRPQPPGLLAPTLGVMCPPSCSVESSPTVTPAGVVARVGRLETPGLRVGIPSLPVQLVRNENLALLELPRLCGMDAAIGALHWNQRPRAGVLVEGAHGGHDGLNPPEVGVGSARR